MHSFQFWLQWIKKAEVELELLQKIRKNGQRSGADFSLILVLMKLFQSI